MQKSRDTPRGIRFGAFELDLRSGELHKYGIRIRLQDQPFKILVALLEKPGEVVTRDELKERIWGDDTFVDFDHGLSAAVNRLREALGDSAENPKYVETLARRGYRFVGAIEGTLKSVAPESPVRALGRPYRKIVGIAAVLLAVTGAGLWLTRDRAQAPMLAVPTIAVLPFENLSGDPGQEYLADGITDALITDLAMIRSLSVISRSSTMRFKGSRKPASEIARDLGAQYLVEGGVARSGGQVRVTAQLIDGRSDHHVWAQRYEREIADLFRLQGELVHRIAGEIRIQLRPDVEKDLQEASVVREKALDAYLKGRFAQEQRTEEAAARSARFFEEAIAEEPGFALAHSWLAAAYRTSVVMGNSPAVEMLDRATAAARTAVGLAPRLPDARSSLAVSYSMDWNWRAAEPEFRRALDLSPHNSDAHHRYAALYLAPLGRLDEAETEMRTALELDRTSLNNRVLLGKILYFRREYDAAVRELREVERMDPNYPDGLRNLGAVYTMKGMYREALALHTQAQSLSAISWGTGLIAHALAVSGKRVEATQTVRQLIEDRGRRYTSPLAIATAFAGLGNYDEAFRWFDHALREHDWRLMLIKVDPIYDPLRDDRRFQRLLTAVGLE